MIPVIASVLAVLWLAGLVTDLTFGGLIHILAGIAVLMLMLNYYLTRTSDRLWEAERSQDKKLLQKPSNFFDAG